MFYGTVVVQRYSVPPYYVEYSTHEGKERETVWNLPSPVIHGITHSFSEGRPTPSILHPSDTSSCCPSPLFSQDCIYDHDHNHRHGKKIEGRPFCVRVQPSDDKRSAKITRFQECNVGAQSRVHSRTRSETFCRLPHLPPTDQRQSSSPLAHLGIPPGERDGRPAWSQHLFTPSQPSHSPACSPIQLAQARPLVIPPANLRSAPHPVPIFAGYAISLRQAYLLPARIWQTKQTKPTSILPSHKVQRCTHPTRTLPLFQDLRG